MTDRHGIEMDPGMAVQGGILAGIQVVDLSWGIAGPFATGQMSDHGASVIRVEPPGGDPYRTMVARAALDRGKRSIAVDLRNEHGRAVLERLLSRADVLVESWRPGVAARLGVDYETIRERHPELVYCSISGYGQDGADRDRPGYDSLVSARAGLMGQGSNGAPVFPGAPYASIGAGHLAVIAVMAALLERERTGQGQWVETSLFDGLLAFMNMFWEELENLPESSNTPSIPRSRRLFAGIIQCGDGEYLGVHTGANGSHARFMEALGLSDRVKPAPGNREKTVPLTSEEQEVIVRDVPRLFQSETREYWLQRLIDHDVCAIPVLRPGEAFSEPQVLHNEMVVRIEDADLGPVDQVGIAVRFSKASARIQGRAPLPGEHTEQILAEIGYDPAEDASIHGTGRAG
jgi:crotonobetainyl-CoA:carnitine CoA-transferase CaiB-like acyl-CoA transferase